MDWAHTKKVRTERNKREFAVESAGPEKAGKTKNDMAERDRCRDEKDGKDMARPGRHCRGQEIMESLC